jgi:hypothetical protein
MTAVVVETAGAVNKPDKLIVPAVTDQLTALFDVLLTVAVNCCCPPEMTDAFAGAVETPTV